MKAICPHCFGDIDEGPNDGNDGTDKVSNGFCESCALHYIRQWESLNMGEYLNMQQYPVLLVNDEGRVLASNQRMSDFLGKSEFEMFCNLGGDVIECVYAQLPEGCGKTNHCKACGIRISVTMTFESGEPIIRARVYLDREKGRTHFLISTYKRYEAVQIVIEEVSDSV